MGTSIVLLLVMKLVFASQSFAGMLTFRLIVDLSGNIFELRQIKT